MGLRRPRLSGARSTSAAASAGIDLFDELDLGPLEEAVQFFDVCLVEIELGYRRRNVGVGKNAQLLTAVDEALDLFEFLQFRY